MQVITTARTTIPASVCGTGERYDLGKPLDTIPDNPTSLRFGTKPIEGNGKKSIQDDSVFIVNGVKIYDNLPKINYKVSPKQDRKSIYDFLREDVVAGEINDVVKKLLPEYVTL